MAPARAHTRPGHGGGASRQRPPFRAEGRHRQELLRAWRRAAQRGASAAGRGEHLGQTARPSRGRSRGNTHRRGSIHARTPPAGSADHLESKIERQRGARQRGGRRQQQEGDRDISARMGGNRGCCHAACRRDGAKGRAQFPALSRLTMTVCSEAVCEASRGAPAGGQHGGGKPRPWGPGQRSPTCFQADFSKCCAQNVSNAANTSSTRD